MIAICLSVCLSVCLRAGVLIIPFPNESANILSTAAESEANAKTVGFSELQKVQKGKIDCRVRSTEYAKYSPAM
jgi:hypothetical protein